MNTNKFWKDKLMAFLHDPPSKPLDIGRHREVAEACLRRAGIDPVQFKEFQKLCDHTAAAADRFPFPASGKLTSPFSGTAQDETPARHPLGGSNLFFDSPFPSPEAAEERLQTCQPGGELEQLPEDDRPWANFFLHWRRWAVAAAEADWRTLFLPADTRLPDHNVWTHNSLVSALQGCVTAGNKLKPAFLLFQLGPVQDFIAQARSTRDLWSGSYLLSWLMAHAIKAVTDQVGPDAVIYPALRGQPLFDLLHRERLYDRLTYASGDGRPEETLWKRLGLDRRTAEILTPTFPNRFLALVPAGRAADLARLAEAAVRDELSNIGQHCWAWLNREGLTPKEEWTGRFFRQIELFPKISWQTCPWGKGAVKDAVKAFEGLDRTAAENLRKVYDLATKGIPKDDRNQRYFTKGDGEPDLRNRGFCWSYDYALTDSLLAARRRLRDFRPLETDENQFGTPKDSLSGVEEVVGSEDWWEKLRSAKPNLFRSADRLGALNVIKRVWHEAYLEGKFGLQGVRSALRFESVPGVAAGKWRDNLLDRAERCDEIWHRLLAVRQVLLEHRKAAQGPNLNVSEKTSESEWLKHTDPGCFCPAEWNRAEEPDSAVAQEVIEALNGLYHHEPGEESLVTPPPTYFAVLALDGDHMGEWISGERTPPLFDQLSKTARDYFSLLRSKEERKEWKEPRRPLAPSYHLQFSEALANFGLYLADPIVEHFGGQLIYSGGDDVMAMLPAETVLDCAEALHAAFQGGRRLAELMPDQFEVVGENGGYVRLRGTLAKNGRPTWPLVVPGPRADCSAGIAIGHIHAPLQGVVDAARHAEHRAKDKRGLGRGACAVSLYKRSGEIVEWGFKWDSGALELCRSFKELSSIRPRPLLSGRFGYALKALLRPYEPSAAADRPVFEDVPGFAVRHVVERELGHVLSRQWQGDFRNRDHEERKRRFKDLCLAYLEKLESRNRPLVEDFPRLFDTVNFIMRGES